MAADLKGALQVGLGQELLEFASRDQVAATEDFIHVRLGVAQGMPGVLGKFVTEAGGVLPAASRGGRNSPMGQSGFD
jgi:hypothetical protein